MQIEVELRGRLGAPQLETLKNLVDEEGLTASTQKRLLLDYSTFVEGVGQRTLDVRLRITNGRLELIAKRGEFGGTNREEASLFIDESDLDSALGFYSLLGYSKAVVCVRHITRFSFEKIGRAHV